MTPEKKPTLDERIEALVQSTELLKYTVDKHEQQWERFRKVMRAALETWLEDEPGDTPEGAAQ